MVDLNHKSSGNQKPAHQHFCKCGFIMIYDWFMIDMYHDLPHLMWFIINLIFVYLVFLDIFYLDSASTTRWHRGLGLFLSGMLMGISNMHKVCHIMWYMYIQTLYVVEYIMSTIYHLCRTYIFNILYYIKFYYIMLNYFSIVLCYTTSYYIISYYLILYDTKWYFIWYQNILYTKLYHRISYYILCAIFNYIICIIKNIYILK
jgi:hypothetical protein